MCGNGAANGRVGNAVAVSAEVFLGNGFHAAHGGCTGAHAHAEIMLRSCSSKRLAIVQPFSVHQQGFLSAL